MRAEFHKPTPHERKYKTQKMPLFSPSIPSPLLASPLSFPASRYLNSRYVHLTSHLSLLSHPLLSISPSQLHCLYSTVFSSTAENVSCQKKSAPCSLASRSWPPPWHPLCKCGANHTWAQSLEPPQSSSLPISWGQPAHHKLNKQPQLVSVLREVHPVLHAITDLPRVS